MPTIDNEKRRQLLKAAERLGWPAIEILGRRIGGTRDAWRFFAVTGSAKAVEEAWKKLSRIANRPS